MSGIRGSHPERLSSHFSPPSLGRGRGGRLQWGRGRGGECRNPWLGGLGELAQGLAAIRGAELEEALGDAAFARGGKVAVSGSAAVQHAQALAVKVIFGVISLDPADVLIVGDGGFRCGGGYRGGAWGGGGSRCRCRDGDGAGGFPAKEPAEHGEGESRKGKSESRN